MLRRLLAAFLGAIVFFLWGFIFWGMDTLVEGIVHTPKDEAGLQAAILQHTDGAGVYKLPFEGHASSDEDEREAYLKAYEAGPLVHVFVNEGRPRSDAQSGFMIRGFLHGLAAAGIAVWLLTLTNITGYGRRVFFIFGVGLFGGVAMGLNGLAWWNHPADFAFYQFVYYVVGWPVAGLVMAKALPSAPTEG